GVLGVLMAPREKRHVIREIPVADIPSRPTFEKVEWAVRLVLIALAALIIGTRLTDRPDALTWTVAPLGEGLTGAIAASTAQGDLPGVLIQFAYVIVGFVLLTVACWPIPGYRTRPGAYLAGSFGAPLMDFFNRFGKLTRPILALICLYR